MQTRFSVVTLLALGIPSLLAYQACNQEPQVVSREKASELFGGKKNCARVISDDSAVWLYCGNCSDEDPNNDCDCSFTTSVYRPDSAGVAKKVVPCTIMGTCGKPDAAGCG